MRPPLSSRSSTKPCGSKIHACSHSDFGEVRFWWRNCHWGEKNRKILIRFLKFLSVNFLKIWQISNSLLAFLAFNLSEKFVRQGFRLAKKHKKMLKTKKLPWQPLLFSILKVSSCQTLPGLSISENFTAGNWRKIKKWRCLSRFNLRLKALIPEVTAEQ